MWKWPSRLLANAIERASGDHSGWSWKNRPAGVDGSPFSFVSRHSCLSPPSTPKSA
jgi:hypothetical protein